MPKSSAAKQTGPDKVAPAEPQWVSTPTKSAKDPAMHESITTPSMADSVRKQGDELLRREVPTVAKMARINDDLPVSTHMDMLVVALFSRMGEVADQQQAMFDRFSRELQELKGGQAAIAAAQTSGNEAATKSMQETLASVTKGLSETNAAVQKLLASSSASNELHARQQADIADLQRKIASIADTAKETADIRDLLKTVADRVQALNIKQDENAAVMKSSETNAKLTKLVSAIAERDARTQEQYDSLSEAMSRGQAELHAALSAVLAVKSGSSTDSSMDAFSALIKHEIAESAVEQKRLRDELHKLRVCNCSEDAHKHDASLQALRAEMEGLKHSIGLTASQDATQAISTGLKQVSTQIDYIREGLKVFKDEEAATLEAVVEKHIANAVKELDSSVQSAKEHTTACITKTETSIVGGISSVDAGIRVSQEKLERLRSMNATAHDLLQQLHAASPATMKTQIAAMHEELTQQRAALSTLNAAEVDSVGLLQKVVADQTELKEHIKRSVEASNQHTADAIKQTESWKASQSASLQQLQDSHAKLSAELEKALASFTEQYTHMSMCFDALQSVPEPSFETLAAPMETKLLAHVATLLDDHHKGVSDALASATAAQSPRFRKVEEELHEINKKLGSHDLFDAGIRVPQHREVLQHLDTEKAAEHADVIVDKTKAALIPLFTRLESLFGAKSGGSLFDVAATTFRRTDDIVAACNRLGEQIASVISKVDDINGTVTRASATAALLHDRLPVLERLMNTISMRPITDDVLKEQVDNLFNDVRMLFEKTSALDQFVQESLEEQVVETLQLVTAIHNGMSSGQALATAQQQQRPRVIEAGLPEYRKQLQVCLQELQALRDISQHSNDDIRDVKHAVDILSNTVRSFKGAIETTAPALPATAHVHSHNQNRHTSRIHLAPSHVSTSSVRTSIAEETDFSIQLEGAGVSRFPAPINLPLSVEERRKQAAEKHINRMLSPSKVTHSHSRSSDSVTGLQSPLHQLKAETPSKPRNGTSNMLHMSKSFSDIDPASAQKRTQTAPKQRPPPREARGVSSDRSPLLSALDLSTHAQDNSNSGAGGAVHGGTLERRKNRHVNYSNTAAARLAATQQRGSARRPSNDERSLSVRRTALQIVLDSPPADTTNTATTASAAAADTPESTHSDEYTPKQRGIFNI